MDAYTKYQSKLSLVFNNLNYSMNLSKMNSLRYGKSSCCLLNRIWVCQEGMSGGLTLGTPHLRLSETLQIL
jgi:hypothetical protein